MLNWKIKPGYKNIEEKTGKNKVVYLSFSAFEKLDFVKHVFSTRLGGVSEANQSTMNLSFTKEPLNKNNVLENFSRMAEVLEVKIDDFVFTHQTHTTNIRRAGLRDRGKGITAALDYSDIDGLITDTPGVVLSAFFADCIPLYFADPAHKAVGLAHSGWKGTLDKIGAVLIAKMGEEFGTRPEDLIAGIGPGICQDCYEVSEEVAKKFKEVFITDKENAGFKALNPADILRPCRKGHYYLDLWKTNEYILINSGIKPENIYTAGICTRCNSNLLFSHRAMGEDRGNLAAFIGIKL